MLEPEDENYAVYPKNDYCTAISYPDVHLREVVEGEGFDVERQICETGRSRKDVVLTPSFSLRLLLLIRSHMTSTVSSCGEYSDCA